jgi:hypothetical protein
VQGFQRTRRCLGIATERLAGKTSLVRATGGVVTLTGESVSSNAVAGSSTRGTINAKHTNDISKIAIVRLKSFTGLAPQVANKIRASGLRVNVKILDINIDIRGREPAHPGTGIANMDGHPFVDNDA